MTMLGCTACNEVPTYCRGNGIVALGRAAGNTVVTIFSDNRGTGLGSPARNNVGNGDRLRLGASVDDLWAINRRFGAM